MVDGTGDAKAALVTVADAAAEGAWRGSEAWRAGNAGNAGCRGRQSFARKWRRILPACRCAQAWGHRARLARRPGARAYGGWGGARRGGGGGRPAGAPAGWEGGRTT